MGPGENNSRLPPRARDHTHTVGNKHFCTHNKVVVQLKTKAPPLRRRVLVTVREAGETTLRRERLRATISERDACTYEPQGSADRRESNALMCFTIKFCVCASVRVRICAASLNLCLSFSLTLLTSSSTRRVLARVMLAAWVCVSSSAADAMCDWKGGKMESDNS